MISLQDHLTPVVARIPDEDVPAQQAVGGHCADPSVGEHTLGSQRSACVSQSPSWNRAGREGQSLKMAV